MSLASSVTNQPCNRLIMVYIYQRTDCSGSNMYYVKPASSQVAVTIRNTHRHRDMTWEGVCFFFFSYSFLGLGGCKSKEKLTKCSVTNPNIGSHGKKIQKNHA